MNVSSPQINSTNPGSSSSLLVIFGDAKKRFDRNQDGKIDVWRKSKAYVGAFRFSDSFFDDEFKGCELNGLLVLREDNNYDGYFETKTLKERDKSGKM